MAGTPGIRPGQLAGTVAVVEEGTGPLNLTAEDSNKLYANEGAAGEVLFNLPSAVAGLRYSFAVVTAQSLKVVAASGDTIRVAGSVSAAAGNAANATIGGTLEVVAVNTDEWFAVSSHGTWTVT